MGCHSEHVDEWCEGDLISLAQVCRVGFSDGYLCPVIYRIIQSFNPSIISWGRCLRPGCRLILHRH